MFLPLLVSIALAQLVAGQNPPARFVWPEGKKAAVVLTYDDALNSHLDVAIPQLNDAKLVGTFFLNAYNITPKQMLRWRDAARGGHELGNHSVNHPCPRAILPNREHYATEIYDVPMMLSEISVMNDVLFGIDGKEGRTYAQPCAQTIVGGVDYTEALRRSGLIKYARMGGGPNAIITNFAGLDPLLVPSYGFLDHPTAPTLVAYVKRVADSGGMGVLMFHGVGGDYLEVTADTHKEVLRYLHEHPEIWVGTFQQVMDWVVQHQRHE